MDPLFQTIYDDYQNYVMHTYSRGDIAFTRGEGVMLYDTQNKRYLDFAAGISVCNLGHCPRVVTEAICAQAAKLVHVSNLYLNEHQGALAHQLVDLTFDGAVFFCNSGAEANEGMIKLARQYGNRTGRNEIIVMDNSFHGRTLATLAATGRAKYRVGFQPDMPGFIHVPYNSMTAVEEAAAKSKCCAVMLELVQGEGGIIPADPAFVKALRAFCTAHDILLLVDEVQTGIGRTGKLFSFQNFGIEPDVFSMAKAIANGFPMGAFLCKRAYADVLKPGMHASTFGGTALACAAARATLTEIMRILPEAAVRGEKFRAKLRTLIGTIPAVKDVRGLGLMYGIALDRPAAEILPALRERGVLALSAGETVLRLMPPLITTDEQFDQAFDILRDVLSQLN